MLQLGMRSKQRGCVIQIVVLCLAFYPCVCYAGFTELQQRQFQASLHAVLPPSWHIAREETNVIPEGHYWGQPNYEGDKGTLFVLEGGNDVHLHWQDDNGGWHTDAVAKECVMVWVMPEEYKESWKRFFVMKRPRSAKLMSAGKIAKTYALPTHCISDESIFDRMPHMISIRWPDSPARTGDVSWESWKKDIKEAFQQY